MWMVLNIEWLTNVHKSQCPPASAWRFFLAYRMFREWAMEGQARIAKPTMRSVVVD